MARDYAYREAEKKIEEVRRGRYNAVFLSNLGITELPESLQQLKYFRILDLSYNQLTTLPDWLEQFTSLGNLLLNNNQLTSLPDGLGKLTQLHILQLDYNQLTSLPSTLGNLSSLTHLTLGGNQIRTLPDWNEKLERLRVLVISNNKLASLPSWIGNLKYLHALWLQDCQLTLVPEWLSRLKNLEVLSLNGNLLSDLPAALAQLPDLDRLELDDNPLNPELANAYKQGLEAVKAYLRAKAKPSKVVRSAAVKLKKSRSKRTLKVFLCHASQDKGIVHELYEKFIAEGWIESWLDTKKLLPGQDWQAEIRNAVEKADNVIIFLSNTSINKDGFIQKELRLAKDIALEKTEGSLFLIPLRLDDCDAPRSLQIYQWADYFGTEKEQTYNRLLESLKLRLEDIKRKEIQLKQNSENKGR